VKILLVTPFLAYPNANGGGTAVFNLIRNLAQRHEVFYLSLARQEDLSHLAEVRPFCSEVITVALPGGAGLSLWKNLRYVLRRVMYNLLSFMTLTPVTVWKCRERAMCEALSREIARHEPDVVHICFPQMAHYVEFCKGIPAVMDTLDAALLGAFRRAMNARNLCARAYYWMQWRFWVRYESRWFPRFGKVLTVTSQDAAALRMAIPELDIHSDAIAVETVPRLTTGGGTERKIGFLASFAHHPNVDAARYFAESIFPLIRGKIADAQFVVAGRNPPSFLLDRRNEGISCCGFVEDVAEFYGTMDVVVAPLRYGGGIKIKILEAMACGKAVVTTSTGAEGIADAAEGALIVADDPALFAAAVSELLGDAKRREALGERARELVERRFSWQRVLDDLDGIYAALAGMKR